MDHIRHGLGYEGGFIVETRGHSGGIAMMWKNGEEGKLLSYSANHIDLEINIDGLPEFRLTGFSGEPNRSLRRST